MTPARIHSTICRVPSNEWPWLPICVTTPVRFAVAASTRDSCTDQVSGFCTYTALPACIARFAATA